MSAKTEEKCGGVPALLDRLIEPSSTARSSLIPILQAVQEAEGYLSREAVVLVAKRLELPVSKVYGVATFYNQFRFQPPGRFHIQVCRGTACHVKGSLGILETIERNLEIKPDQTTRDGMFSLEIVACIGACGLAPVICVNGKYHANVTSGDVKRILQDYRQTALEGEESDAS